MADLPISSLPSINAAEVQPNIDQLALADTSASETKKVTPTAAVTAALSKTPANGGLPNDTILADKIDWSGAQDESVPGRVIQKNSLNGDRIVDKSITSGKIGDGEVKTLNIENQAVTTDKIRDLAVTTEKIADAAVTSQKLATNAAVDNIALNSLDGSKIIDETITSNKIVDGAITAEKLGVDAAIDNITAGSITTEKLADGLISTDKLADGAVTSQKLATDAAINNIGINTLDGTKIIDKSIDGSTKIIDGSITSDQLAVDSVSTIKIQDFAITNQKLADNSVTARNLDGSIIDPDGGLELTDQGIGIENDIISGVFAGISYDEHGLITAVDPSGLVPSTDLPPATETTLGAVIVPTTGGLSVTGTGELSHSNLIVPGTFAGIIYDNHGHITSVSPDGQIPSSSVPIAGTTADDIGGIYVPPSSHLDVAPDGALTHDANTIAGTYTKVTVDSAGHVTLGEGLSASDIPAIDAGQIAGEIGSDQLAECSVTAPKICDYATCLMQEDNPGAGDFLGQFWYTPSTAQLRVYARGSGPENIWLPVGFGALQANNLRWGGTYDADTDTVVSLTAIGTSEGLTAGQPFPPPSDQKSGLYFICQTPGNSMVQPNLNGINHTAGDWALCIDAAQGWIHIDANASSGGGGGSAQYLNDLLDVEIGGAASPFSTAPAVALSGDHLLRFDGGAGLWRNTDIIDGGSID